MHTIYHLSSAQDLDSELLDAIKATYKARPIKIIVEEDDVDFELTAEMIAILDERLNENESAYLSAEASISALKEKFGV